jgi:hypothetical protein
MKTTTEIKFERLIKEGFHEILKPLGFKKKGNNFYIKGQDLGQIINIQKSTFYSKDHIHFTINTGLFLPEYWQGKTSNKGKEVPTFPNEYECLIRKRIGELRKQNDIWFDINQHIDDDKLINDMRTNLEEYILPYFNSIQSKETLLLFLDTEQLILSPFDKLIVYGELKQIEKANKEYQKILEGENHPSYLETLNEYKFKYGF